MAAVSSIIASAGVYNLANPGVLLGGFVGKLTGEWSELIVTDPSGDTYYLEARSENGNAYAELIKGQLELQYGVANGSGEGIQHINPVTQGGLNSTVPISKWLYIPSQKIFYKIISVLNNNLIQVANNSGQTLDSQTVESVVTIGFSVKNILLTVNTGATVKTYGYRSGLMAPQGNEIEYPGGVVPSLIPVDLENSGPIFIEGGAKVVVQGRYSNAE